MKLERLHESVTITVALIGGLWVALLCGYMVGNDDIKTAALIIGGICVIALLLITRERIWMIIPALWQLNGKVNALPAPFSVAQLGILLAFGMYLALKALKVVRFKPKMGVLEVWMLIVLGYLFTVFLRNPVGVESMGADRVGGKPYVDVLVACAAYWVLARVVVTERQAFFAPLLGLIGGTFHAVINFLAFRYSWMVGPLANLYSGVAAAENNDPLAPLPEENSRLGYLQGLGGGLTGTACSFWRPFTVINPLNFGRFVIFALGCACILLSGFRSNLMGIFQVFVLSSYFRRGWGEVLKVVALAAGVVGVLWAAQGNVLDLPLPAQRALSFLPGKWEEAAKKEAQGSTEWRIEMWKAMLDGDKYIKNKWLGDGFGFTHQQLEMMAQNTSNGGIDAAQENLMIGGGVHSGPVSSIRFVGYIGLALFVIFLGLLAVRAARLIRRAQGTPYFPLSLAIGMGSILFPFNFLFIFGAYEGDLPSAILAVGMQKLLENSLEAYEERHKKNSPEVIQPPKHRPARQFAPVG